MFFDSSVLEIPNPVGQFLDNWSIQILLTDNKIGTNLFTSTKANENNILSVKWKRK